MNWDLNPRSRQFIASVFTTYVGILIALLLAITSDTISTEVGFGLGLLFLGGAIIAEYSLTYSPLVQYRERQLSTFFNDYLGLVEQEVERVANGDVEVRANVMRPTRDGFRDEPTYSIAFWHDESDYTDAEFDLEFEIGQGCVGQTHENGQQMFAITPDHTDPWEETWNTTNIQEEVAGHLNTIIGTPIYRPSDRDQTKPVAVLIIDSEHDFEEFVDLGPNETLADVEFKQTPVAQLAVDLARNVGILL